MGVNLFVGVDHLPRTRRRPAEAKVVGVVVVGVVGGVHVVRNQDDAAPLVRNQT